MSDLKTILYGKTSKVTLADGKDYILREPDIESLEGLDTANLTELKNIKKLALIMLRNDNEGIDEKSIGRLIVFSMLNKNSSFMKAFLSLLGLDEKNEVAGA